MPHYVVKGDVKMGKGLLGYGLKSNFDLAAAEELLRSGTVLAAVEEAIGPLA